MQLIIIITAILLTLIIIYIGYLAGKKAGEIKTNAEWKDNLPNIRNDAVKRSRAVLSGQFSEQLAPYLPDFKFKPTEICFLGKPIDFIVFKGMDEKDISEIVFVEVKSGKSKLSTHEKKLKQAIENKKIRYELYQIPEKLTKSG